MNCHEIREHLLDLVVAEPGPGELRDHLTACAACAAELNSLRQAMALLAGVVPQARPGGHHDGPHGRQHQPLPGKLAGEG
jgi:hypothetical protein